MPCPLTRDLELKTKPEIKNEQEWEAYAEERRLPGRWINEKPVGRE